MKQVPLTSLVSSPRKIGGNEQEKITQSIADMIVSDHVPLSIVESKGFRNLVEIVAPDYKVPCRKTIHSRIVRRYDGEKDALMSKLGSVGNVSLTTDTWTSNSTESYITFIEHHIDDQWKMGSNVLLIRAMPERNTGENLTSEEMYVLASLILTGRFKPASMTTPATLSAPATCAKNGRTSYASATPCSSA